MNRPVKLPAALKVYGEFGGDLRRMVSVRLFRPFGDETVEASLSLRENAAVQRLLIEGMEKVVLFRPCPIRPLCNAAAAEKLASPHQLHACCFDRFRFNL